jgi:hypothetical protein
MRARVVWKKPDEGGRKSPPAGVGTPPYATVVRLLDCDEPWPPMNAWSLVVDKVSTIGDEYHWLADVRYLMSDAPHNELILNRRFELYEGAKCVAAGVIVEE